MPEYKAPLREMRFVLHEFLEIASHYQKLQNCEQLDVETIDAVMVAGGDFAENVIGPLNRVGDEQGCTFHEGNVATPDGFAAAFYEYAKAGWQGLSIPKSHGGQGIPGSCSIMFNEILGSANFAWTMTAGLAHAPITLLLAAGSDEQKAIYLPKLVNAEWAGTMCLTEAHCGSDVGLVRTKATKNSDGSYSISGTKMFISGGEQDITNNIIHTVLARVDGAPEGTKGISVFIVPKILIGDNGELGKANHVNCGSIEHKMGLNGSPTCVMNFDGATGYLLGDEGRGLDIMFSIMNTARLGTALQGVSMGESSFQGALSYARERLQMRSLTGPKNPSGPADPIIVHPDVRRMLMTQKALTEGSRAFIYWLAQLGDVRQYGAQAKQQPADDLLSFLTPIAKAFCTEIGLEVTNLGMQVYGGHGYIREHGMEQLVRDARISTLYEGTTGIQSLDLLGRKIMGSQGQLLFNFTRLIHLFCQENSDNDAMLEFIAPLLKLNKEWGELTAAIGSKAMQNPDEIGAASVDYLMFSGYVAVGFMWARMALRAQQQNTESVQSEFYSSKVTTARFYFARILPRSGAHAHAALAGADTVMSLSVDEFRA